MPRRVVVAKYKLPEGRFILEGKFQWTVDLLDTDTDQRIIDIMKVRTKGWVSDDSEWSVEEEKTGPKNKTWRVASFQDETKVRDFLNRNNLSPSEVQISYKTFFYNPSVVVVFYWSEKELV